MEKFLFKTDTVMKPYNQDKWWIDEQSVQELVVSAETLKEALAKYVDHVHKKSSINISKNAIKRKSPIFKDLERGEPVQIGYLLTGSTDLQDMEDRWSKQYVDLWVTIYSLSWVTF